MKKKLAIIVSILLVITVSFTTSQAQKTNKGSNKTAKISLDEARAIALKAVSGKVKSEELEKEHGLLIYSFDLETSDGLQEVQVDAKTGKVLKVEKETPEDEAKEKNAEAKEKRKKH